MEKRYMYKLFLGIVIMAAGMILTAFFETDALVPLTLIYTGLIIFVLMAFRLFRRGDLPDRDERTKKLSAYGITYSWLLTLVLLTILYWLEYFKLVEFTVNGIFGLLIFFMIISANVFRWYFMQKGDVD